MRIHNQSSLTMTMVHLIVKENFIRILKSLKKIKLPWFVDGTAGDGIVDRK